MGDHVKILLAEDDPNLGLVLREFLELRGYSIKWCEDGEKALDAFQNQAFDICILDIMMPKKDGFTLAEDIRKVDGHMPIIFLTAKSLEEDRIKGFRTGADDYITKPFSKEELILRIKAIIKRAHRVPDSNGKVDLFEIGHYQFHYSKRLLTVNGFEKKLTFKEAEILKLLSIKINEVLPRDWAQKKVWGENNYFVGRSMDVFITKLRKYLKEDPRISIENIHGKGFVLRVE